MAGSWPGQIALPLAVRHSGEVRAGTHRYRGFGGGGSPAAAQRQSGSRTTADISTFISGRTRPEMMSSVFGGNGPSP